MALLVWSAITVPSAKIQAPQIINIQPYSKDKPASILVENQTISAYGEKLSLPLLVRQFIYFF